MRWLTWDLPRRYDTAVEQYRNVVELDPGFVPARLALGQAYVQKQMFPEAIRELEKAVDFSGGSPVYLASLAHAYGVTGRRRDTFRMIDQLKNLAGRRYVASFDMALAWLGLGDRDRASLERSVADRSPRLLFLAVEPRFDPLRSNRRLKKSPPNLRSEGPSLAQTRGRYALPGRAPAPRRFLQ
jgi:tetratricopeptide (TPR) repeat protein